MTFAMQHDIESWVVGGFGHYEAVITAGAGNDNVEVNGPWLDRRNDVKGPHLSVAVMILWEAVLTNSKTLSLAANLQDATSAVGAGAADFGTALANAVVATSDASPNETIRGVTKFAVNLGAARQFLRLQLTANLSATGTDTVKLAAVFVFGGDDVLPAE